jgi:NosR/NirI family transcriptional regulator, nitrous oxide reductase regulator
MDMRDRRRACRTVVCAVYALLMLCGPQSLIAGNALDALALPAVREVFPAADELAETLDVVPARVVRAHGEVLGWVYFSDALQPVPAYSGKPVRVLVGITPEARIAGVRLIAHEEPILVIGLSDRDLQRFTDQYAGLASDERVRVGAQARAGYHGIDGISGATITAMVINQSIMRSALQLSERLGLPRGADAAVQAGAGMPDGAVALAPGGELASRPLGFERLSTADWAQLWLERPVRITVLIAALLLLVAMLVFQDWLVLRPLLFERLRVGYLLFTVGFVGFYCMGQLSIVNMLAFGRALSGGFSWDTLLLEPVAFILWGFVAVTIVLWGRGVYCGWLCPFGALQELVRKAAERFGVPARDFPPMVHERLWAIKYLILIGLFGLSLDSMARAAMVAEVEPFKTVFALHFARDWGFVVYALALLGIAAFNSKLYCKYLCPLGAALSFFTRFRIFDWLRRRRQCGNPCQTCASQCQIGAIRPTGQIIDNECHYCLECQVTYWDEHRCPPLVEKRKRRERRAQKARVDIIASSNDNVPLLPGTTQNHSLTRGG